MDAVPPSKNANMSLTDVITTVAQNHNLWPLASEFKVPHGQKTDRTVGIAVAKALERVVSIALTRATERAGETNAQSRDE